MPQQFGYPGPAQLSDPGYQTEYSLPELIIVLLSVMPDVTACFFVIFCRQNPILNICYIILSNKCFVNSIVLLKHLSVDFKKLITILCR